MFLSTIAGHTGFLGIGCPHHPDSQLNVKTTLSASPHQGDQEIHYGILSCGQCKAEFPIVEGVAILVPELDDYFYEHAKGISTVLPKSAITNFEKVSPPSAIEAYETGLSEISELRNQQAGFVWEEDLETERVTHLYLLNHYVPRKQLPKNPDPVIEELLAQHWDQSPLALAAQKTHGERVLELGSGVGGLLSKLALHKSGSPPKTYLGIDQSFLSTHYARKVSFFSPHGFEVIPPHDLLMKPSKVSPLKGDPISLKGIKADFVVGGIAGCPARENIWDSVIALNALDMVDPPQVLPRTQARLGKKGAEFIQSCPYLWPPKSANGIPSPKFAQDLYGKEGLKITFSQEHVPWLFFKHERQLEYYSVHMFIASKN